MEDNGKAMANGSGYKDTGAPNTSTPPTGTPDDTVLWNLNLSMLQVFYPAAIMVLILQIIGISGNGLVIYVYHVHFRKTTANLFIKVLALLDVFCCIFGMSYEQVDLCFSVMNGEVVSCKLFRGIEQSLEFISGEILLCIALDRYLHICQPFTNFTIRSARRLAFASVVIGLLVSSPSLLLVGPAEIELHGVKTMQCTFDAHYKNSSVRFYYYICLNGITGISFITMIALYIRIWAGLCQWQKTRVGENMQTRVVKKQHVHSEVFKGSTEILSSDVLTENKITILSMRVFSVSLTCESSTESPCADRNKQLKPPVSKIEKMKRKRLVKPVMILFFVTMVFVLSFLPYFIMMLLHSSGVVEPYELSMNGRRVWEMGYKSYFLSNAINPLIYAAFDKNFRTICYSIVFSPGFRQ